MRTLLKLSHAFNAITLIALVSVLIGIVFAENANFIVQPQKQHVIPIGLQETDSVSGSFSVVSDDDTGVDFFVIDPENQTILRLDNIKQRSFSFIAQATGNFKLCFDNSISSDYSKTVALNYSVTHYIMGLPQEQFFLIVIAIVALIGVVVYVALMPK